MVVGDEVLVYDLKEISSDASEPEPCFYLHCPHEASSSRQGDINQDMPNVINNVRCELIGDLEYFITANDCGKVAIYDVQKLNREPIIYDVQHSAWGLAVSPLRILGISSNSHNVNLFHLSPEFKRFKEDYHSPWFRQETLVLEGHEHNIPCITFNSSGTLLLSGSIDRSLQIWDITSLSCLCKFYTKLSIWGVKFIDKNAFYHISILKHKPGSLIPAQQFGQSPWKPPIMSSSAFLLSHEEDFDDDAVFEGEYYVHIQDELPKTKVKNYFRTYLRQKPEELFIFTTKFSIVLCAYMGNSQIFPLVSSKNCFEEPITPRFQALHRINMIECIPELQSVVCASQSGQLTLLRLICTTKILNGNPIYVYSFVPHKIRLTHLVDAPLLGMSVCPLYPGEENPFKRFKIMLTVYTGKVISVEVQLSENLYDTSHIGNIPL